MHPNKRVFVGVLTVVDVPSDKAPSGARGHSCILTRKAAEISLDSLIGMGVNVNIGLDGHCASSKIGIIDGAEFSRDEIVVTGYIFSRDCPDIIKQLEASEELGMSYEIADAKIEDMRQVVWKITRMTFTGAAILLRHKCACRMTDFILL